MATEKPFKKWKVQCKFCKETKSFDFLGVLQFYVTKIRKSKFMQMLTVCCRDSNRSPHHKENAPVSKRVSELMCSN